MNRKQYNNILYEILNACKANMPKDYSEIIKELQKYKPTSLIWETANAWNQWNISHNAEQVIKLLENKYNLHRIYPGLKECLELLEIVYKVQDDVKNAERIKCTEKLLEEDYIEYFKLQDFCESFVYGEQIEEKEISHQAYILEDYIGYLFSKLNENDDWEYILEDEIYQEVFQEKNITYLLEQISLNPNIILVLIENEENKYYVRYIYKKLQKIVKHIYYLKVPVQCEEQGICIEDTLQISLENAVKTRNGIEFVPVEFIFEDGSSVDNRDYIIRFIHNFYYQEKRMLHIIANGYMIDDLSIRDSIRKMVSRITPYKYEIHECNLCCCICGNYLEYISKIYGEDCKELVNRKADKKFSIVIPARNSSETLRYTLQTCLEQRYQGKYEILVSDNSSENNSAVKDLISELNDGRITYIKTPKEIELSKSFEYAYLHTTGDYIVPIGSDDGVLPWALEVLDYITENYPEEYVIQWERGFYAWPGFNGGQQNQFVIPRKYEKKHLNLYYKSSKSYMESVAEDAQSMYALPLLYINSCFKREYLKVLLDKTGRLWDGPCQDIYMGAINVCINQQILNCVYPLTIAGMSSMSVGAINNTIDTKGEDINVRLQKLRIKSNDGGYCMSYFEHMMDCFRVDIDGIYRCFLRAYNNGVLKNIFFEWKSVFTQLKRNMQLRDVLFEYKMENSRKAAQLQGTDILKWFDENIYSIMKELYLVDEKEYERQFYRRKYVVGENELGGKTLDASEYGVKNIYDAVILFGKLTQLGD